MNRHFYSNGKLLLTSEYLVLDGAKALAIPTVYGQDLNVTTTEKEGLFWTSKNEKGAVWFEAAFQITPELTIKSTTHQKVAKTLLEILQAANYLNPSFLAKTSGFEVATNINFPLEWGLGSSSTLINNIAQWAGINAFELLEKSFRGSGYDIACAQNEHPLVFSNLEKPPLVKKINLTWPFIDRLFFVYLNQKQDSKQSISHYKNIDKGKFPYVEKANHLTQKIIDATTLDDFEDLIIQHELLLSKLLQLPTIKERLFSDYSGSVKSLGGWGGDFVLATGQQAPDYFKEKGYLVVIPFKKMLK